MAFFVYLDPKRFHLCSSLLIYVYPLENSSFLYVVNNADRKA